MIITQLNGGLGNQLFQYAACKALASKHNTVAKYDLAHFGLEGSRPFDLRFFEADIAIASDAEIRALKPSFFFEKAYQRLLPNHKRKAYREPHFHFDKNFFSAGNSVYLKGNWQSEHYFKPVENTIRNNLRIRQKHTAHLQNFCEELQTTSSVSVHIRRGDYLNPHALSYHGVLPETYYNQAVQVISEQISNPVFYIFSDDIAWVQTHIHFNGPCTFVSRNITKQAIEDFYLMQCCKHQIIANSSFSWWAAWLNAAPNKIVVAPQKWFDKGPKDTQDIYPEKWQKL